ncbi:MAG: hypothetical protein AAGJ85_02720, partial [Pseudomonadota bacterium]
LSSVLARDNLHLGPLVISNAAAKRVARGLRHLEAYLRRVLILMALTIEPSLKPNLRENSPKSPKTPRNGRSEAALRLLERRAPPPDFYALQERPRSPKDTRPKQVPAKPFIDRLAAIKALIEAPHARARRLAYALHRRRPGPMLAPDIGRGLVPSRLGTELSATYNGLGHAITTQSRARPPPLPPVPKLPPKIRVL